MEDYRITNIGTLLQLFCNHVLSLIKNWRFLDKYALTCYYLSIPIWERYTLTIEEASKYFRIGENKLRRLAEENKNANWLIMNGNRIQIKRKQFEKIIDTLDAI